MSADPEKMRVWDATAEDLEGLSPDEVRVFRWIVAEMLLVFEAQHCAFKGGPLTEPSWSIKRDMILALLENPIIQDQWDRRMTPFSEEFRSEIDAHRWRSNGSWVHQSVRSTSGTNPGDAA